MHIAKTPKVIEILEAWKARISASHLTSYIYNPADYYLNKILNTREADEMEEELSQRSYGNLVHYALQNIYEKFVGKTLTVKDLELTDQNIVEALNHANEKLNHQVEFYQNGMNFIHKSIAERVVRGVVEYDRKLVAAGNTLEIIGVEGKFDQAEYFLDEEKTDRVSFYGFIDRIVRPNGTVRIIDFKTAKTTNLFVSAPKSAEDEEKLQRLFFREDYKQALQLNIYAYSVLKTNVLPDRSVQCGIW